MKRISLLLISILFGITMTFLGLWAMMPSAHGAEVVSVVQKQELANNPVVERQYKRFVLWYANLKVIKEGLESWHMRCVGSGLSMAEIKLLKKLVKDFESQEKVYNAYFLKFEEIWPAFKSRKDFPKLIASLVLQGSCFSSKIIEDVD